MKKTVLVAASVSCLAACKQVEMNVPNDSAKTASLQAAPNLALLASGNPFKVLSFNVRHHDDSDPQSVDDPKGSISQIIVDNAPDVFGVQEFSDDSFETRISAQMADLGYGEYYDTSITGTPK